MRERPRLAAEVAEVGDADARLLPDLAVDAVLERLTGFDEAGQDAVERLGEPARAGEQQGAPAGDGDTSSQLDQPVPVQYDHLY